MIKRLFPEGSRRRRAVKRWVLDPVVSRHLSDRFRPLDASGWQAVERSLRTNFFSREPAGYLATEAGARDLRNHLVGRLETARRYTIPWLDHVRRLCGARVLEIGCGTGCSTVCLAEQGAKVVAVDIDDLALLDARKRCEVYGLEVDFLRANAVEIGHMLSNERFDFIVFWACLEHMTITERLQAMQATWRMLPTGRLWCLTDTPNRLWHFDAHAAHLPFFLWLPDSLATQCAFLSPRKEFREALATGEAAEAEARLSRWGRGVSFHEFALSMGPVEELPVVSCLAMFNRTRRLAWRLKWLLSSDRRFASLLRKQCPHIHRGFFQPSLDLIIRKV